MAEIAGSDYESVILLDGVTSDTNGASVTVPKNTAIDGAFTWTFMVYGTFGGGTCTLQVSIDGTNWINVPNASFTSDGVVNVSLRAPFVRAVLSGATGPTLTALLV